MQRQVAKMQEQLDSKMGHNPDEQAQTIALQSSTNQKELVMSMTRQTDMLKEQIMQERCRANEIARKLLQKQKKIKNLVALKNIPIIEVFDLKYLIDSSH